MSLRTILILIGIFFLLVAIGPLLGGGPPRIWK